MIKEMASKCNSFYVNERWLGGTLTNLNTIRKSVARMSQIDEMEKNGKMAELPKQEASALRRENQKLHRNLDGIREMSKVPSALVIVDPSRELIAVQEARKLKIPVIALNDTNSDPEIVDYPIAGNDDSIRSIKVVLEYLCEAISDGRGSSKSAGDSKMEMNAVSA